MGYYENIYPGATDYFVPNYEPVGYNFPAGNISVAVDPRTANQLKEINFRMNPGAKNVEIQGLNQKTWDSIPDEHLEEMNKLTKLTGVTPSLHGPLVEASGIGEKGWNELDRESAERQLADMIIRGNKIAPEGNLNVTFHSTAQLPDMQPTIKTEDGEKIKTMWVINPESGKFGAIEPEKRYFPGEEGEFTGEAKKFDPDKELKKLNEDAWVEQLSGINRYADYGAQEVRGIFDNMDPEKKEHVNNIISGSADELAAIKTERERKEIENIQRRINHGQIYLRDSYKNMRGLFDKAYAKADEEDQDKLKKFAEWAAPIVKEGIENNPQKIEQFSEVIEKGLRTLGEIKKPSLYVKLNDFVLDKSSQTFANVATKAFNKFGEKAPIISIENPPAGGGLSRAEDLKKLIEVSRKKFVENLQEKKGMSKSEAKQIAEKLIGATWDVGHINMIRGFGYSDKDVVKETEKIAPFVKHVHLSDNFGYEHTELPMGMGNVPIKEMLQKIEKGSPNKKIKKVIEAGDWFQHFADQGGGHPFKPTLQAFDSPLYAASAGPSWNTLGGYQPYYSGYGPINPPIHHSTYGSGFTTLPTELGGEMPGGGTSRFSGTPEA